MISDTAANCPNCGASYGSSRGSSNTNTNTISFDMVTVPGGIATLNGHAVTLSSFAIGKHAVTQGLWEAVMGTPSPASNAYGKGASFPVYNVSWEDIVGRSGRVGYILNGISYYTDGFCYKLSQLVGGGKQFRLPTEAEWEYAAKGGQQTHNYDYSGSNTLGDVAWYEGNSGGKTHAVGTKAANELGIYDMSGNVWEWCGDWYDGSYPSGTSNPTGASEGSSRVARGGSWTFASYCRVSNRDYYAPSYSHYRLGFRLVLP
jgi:formylglycine-generating enzyme required for sulfatase activity